MVGKITYCLWSDLWKKEICLKRRIDLASGNRFTITLQINAPSPPLPPFFAIVLSINDPPLLDAPPINAFYEGVYLKQTVIVWPSISN